MTEVLYVDDDPEARIVIPRFLQRVGGVREAASLAAARAALAEGAPSLLVVDPDLADGDGTALIDEVRARHPWAQIFVIPRPAWADRTSRFIAAGAHDVAVKPFDVGRIPARAGALLRAAEHARRELAYRQELEQRLSHANRIATLGTMCATVAHEIGNPLTLIGVNVDALASVLRSGRPLEEERAALQQATAEIRVAAGLIRSFAQRIRRFSRRDEQRRTVAPLGPIVDTALLMLKPRLAGRRITVHVPEGDAPEVAHYPIRLTQALLNLLTNAVEAIEDDGNVRLRWIEDDAAAGFAVDDDGRGLSDEARARVFEPFFTSKADGTGIGLTLVRAIVREHDGRFELQPRTPEPGVSARILLPRVPAERSSTP